jgi:hypothetical protein
MAELTDLEWMAEDIETVVEGWFVDEPIRTHDFLDRLEGLTMRRHVHFGSDTTSPVVKQVLATARKIKKELGE